MRLLEVSGIDSYYGDSHILFDLSLEVAPGEVVCLLGRNGAGEPWTADRVFDLFPHLRTLRDRPAGRLSGGEQQMLTIARTLMGNPSLLLLDEPSEGLAPLVLEMLATQLAGLRGTGLTMLVAEQNVHFVSELGDRVYVLEKGMVRYQGTMAEFVGNDEVRRAYLAV